MRWIEHLLGAVLVGILGVILWEQFSGVSISQKAIEIFQRFGIGPGLMIATLAIVALAIWAKSSSG